MSGDAALTFEATVKTNANRSRVTVEDATVRISVKASPIEGKANREAIKVIAHACGVPQRSVVIVRGARSRRKLFRISGLGSDISDFETLLAPKK